MKSTYLNDAWSSTYPFVADAVLPFPMHCIVGAGVCVKPNKGQTSCPAVVITSVEFTEDGISAFICLGDYPMGTVMCGLNQQETARLSTDDWDIIAWLVPGQLDQASLGTYKCSLALDAACVQFMPRDMYGDRCVLAVNTVPHEVPENLLLTASGLLDMYFSRSERQLDTVTNTDLYKDANGCLVLNLVGVPEDAVLSVKDTYSEYGMVTSINGIAVEPTQESDYTRTLHLKIESPKGNLDDWLTVDFLGTLVPYDSIIKAGYNEDYYNDIRAGFLSEYGASMLMTVNGRRNTPSCYDPKYDEANTWGPNNAFV